MPDGNQTFPTFGGLEVGVNDLGLLPEGDAIVTVDGVPNIVTSYGEWNLSLGISKTIITLKIKIHILSNISLSIHQNSGVWGSLQ